jgi:hypothetical protein
MMWCSHTSVVQARGRLVRAGVEAFYGAGAERPGLGRGRAGIRAFFDPSGRTSLVVRPGTTLSWDGVEHSAILGMLGILPDDAEEVMRWRWEGNLWVQLDRKQASARAEALRVELATMAMRVWEARCVATDIWYGSQDGAASRDKWADEEVRRFRSRKVKREVQAAARFALKYPPAPMDARRVSPRSNKGWIGWSRAQDSFRSQEDAGEEAEFAERAAHRARAAGAHLPWY